MSTEELWARFSDAPVRLRGGYLPPAMYGPTLEIQTVPVKCEYPTEEEFDVALIDRTDLRHYDPGATARYGWKSDRFWSQPARAAIEIKHCRIDSNQRRCQDEFGKDVRKLVAYPKKRPDRAFLGLAMMFVQGASIAPTIFTSNPDLPATDRRPSMGIFRCVVTRTTWLFTEP